MEDKKLGEVNTNGCLNCISIFFQHETLVHIPLVLNKKRIETYVSVLFLLDKWR